MDRPNNEVLDITLPEAKERSLAGVFFKIVALPIAVFVVFLLGYLGLIGLKVETHSILMLAVLLIIALILARHNAEYGCLNFQNNIDDFKRELKNYIVANLLSIGGKKKSDASFDLFVDEYGYSLRNQNYASVASAVFPMLGILGTFISIAISMPHFSSSNIDGLETEIAQLLGGVGTAFYVSIYGIFLALWWIYFEKKGISKYERLLIKYKNSTKNFFWNKDEITQGYLSEILNANSEISRSFAMMSSTNFTERLNRLIDEKIGAFESVMEAEKRSMAITQEELEKAGEMIQRTNLAHGELDKSFAQILSALKSVSASLIEIQNGISAQYLSQSKTLTDGQGELTNVTSALSAQIKSLNASLGGFAGEISSSQNAYAAKIDAIFKGLSADLKALLAGEGAARTSNESIIEELRKTLASIDEKALLDENE